MSIEKGINTTKHTQLIHLKWILLLIFPVGYFVTYKNFAEVGFYYVFLNILSFAFCALLLKKLKGFLLKEIVVWLILFVFIVGYYFQFYLINFYYDDREFIFSVYGYDYMLALSNVSLTAFIETFELIVLCFVTFCFVSLVLLKSVFKEKLVMIEIGSNYKSFRTLAFAFTIILSAVTNWLIFHFHLAIPAEAVALPFKMAGLIFYTGAMIVPTTILLMVYLSLRLNDKKYNRLFTCLLIGHSTILYLITGGKSFLILPIILLFFLWLITGQLTAYKIKVLMIFLLLFVFIYPFLGIYRGLLRADLLYGLANIKMLFQTLENEISILQTFFMGIIYILTRVTGINSLLLIVDSSPSFSIERIIELSFGKHSIDYIYTVDIMGFHEGGEKIKGTMIAASLLGQMFYITGSKVLTAIALGTWAIFSYILIKKILKLRLIISPVLITIMLYILLFFSSDGFKAKQFIDMVMLYLFFAVIMENLIRKIVKKRFSYFTKPSIRGIS